MPLETTLLDTPLIDPASLDHAVAEGLLPWHPLDADALTAAHAALLADGSGCDRAALAARLRAACTARGTADADPTRAAALASLADPRATVTVTGQQAGLFSGPLYTVYKAITAIRLARHLEAATGSPVVPIFWNATEDHDLSEIATATLPSGPVTAAFPRDGRAAEALPVGPAADAVATVLAALPPLADAEAIAALLTVRDGERADYGAYSSALIERLFSGTGLVVLEPRDLRPGAVALVQRALREHLALRAALAAGAARLEALGLPVAFEAGEGTGIFYIAPDSGQRRQILYVDPATLLVEGRRRPLADTVAEVEAHPERFSSAAWLRPVWQGALLPTVAYVAGPGELRYHLQLGPVFAFFGVPFPVLRLRNHATVLTPRETALAAKLGLSGTALRAPAADHYNATPLPPDLAARFAAAAASFAALQADLGAATGALLPGATIGAFGARLDRELDRLKAKTHRAWLRRQGVDNARVDRLYAALRPGNVPQERALNLLYLLESLGPAIIPELLAAFDPLESRHYLIHAV